MRVYIPRENLLLGAVYCILIAAVTLYILAGAR